MRRASTDGEVDDGDDDNDADDDDDYNDIDDDDDDDDEIGGGGLLLSDLGRCSSEAITANPGCNPSLSVDIVTIKIQYFWTCI